MSAGEWFESLSDLGAGTFGRRGIPNMSCGVAVHGYGEDAIARRLRLALVFRANLKSAQLS